MENFKQYADNIKQEEDIENEETLEQFTIEGDIKHEPERHFVFIMPDYPEPEIDEEGKEVKIILIKFDRKWKDPAELFKNYFVCGKCDYAAKQSQCFKSHLKTCKNLQRCEKCFLMSKSENFENCGMCDLKFECKNCTTLHQNQDHRKGSTWHCSRCDYKNLNRKYLRSHYQIHVKEFSCETCKRNFAAKCEFNIHQQQHRHGIFASQPETKFDCEICIRSFATKQGLKRHEINFHSKFKLKFHCDICGKTFRTKSNLRGHIQTHFKVPCPICQRMFAKHFLKRHIEEHSLSAKFKCDECKKVYFNKNRLNYHKNTKHEIEEVQCDLCSKVFKNKLLLRKHMTNHFKVSCLICTKLMSKKHLKDHMEKYHSSGEIFLACHIAKCKQKFKNIKEQKDHKKIHIGEGRYKCLKCDCETTSLIKIKRHIKIRSHEI